MRFLMPVLILFCVMVADAAMAAESRKELGLRMDVLTARVQVLEDRMLTGDPAAIRLQQRVDELERQLRDQIGENERLRFENARQRSDIDAIRRELGLLGSDVQSAKETARLARAALGGYITGTIFDPNAPVAVLPPLGTSADDGAAPDLDEPTQSAEARFAEARKILESGFFEQAFVSLSTFVKDFPDHALSGEALYWLGEIQMVRGDAPAAAKQYLTSLKKFKRGALAPDAMVKLAAAFAAMGDQAEACRTLKLFPKEYPKASAAVKTKAEIESRRAGCTP